ncbi:MAG: hypothetical protein R2760_02980 [Chitinophagales bacterium]|nr:hypothetical protein [Bacteroidota bacterium]MCB9074364.1 hypothetical protein [Chitinophagales bacterium]
MKTSKVKLGLKYPAEFSREERQLIIEEYLQSDCTKKEIWQKYTGQSQEKGYLLKWMRQLGYNIPSKHNKLALNKSNSMPKQKAEVSIEILQLKEKNQTIRKSFTQFRIKSYCL